MRQLSGHNLTISAAIIAFILGLATASIAQGLTVQAAVDRNDVYVGEAFTLQIQVGGDDAPAKPDMSVLTDFNVQELGGQQNNSHYYSMINGKVTNKSTKGYVFNYRLTAKKAGRLIIPALTAITSGKKLATQPIVITAKTPEENNDFKLRLQLSKTTTYVGEPLTLSVIWYVGKECSDIQFNLPILADKRFTVVDPLTPANASPRNSLRIPLGDREIVATKSTKMLAGINYTAVSFKLVIIPKQAGDFNLGESTVFCKILSGYHQDSNDPFASFFGRSRRGVYRSVITPANTLQFVVKNLPSKNKPANFSGLIGDYSIATTAAPSKVNIGDPITLTIMITGPDYLENATIPDLNSDPELSRNFKIPAEMAAGEIKGVSKIFTQTIRAKNADVKVIPALALPYFDSASATYKVARSEPIPLEVKQTTTVTAMDAEGLDAAAIGKELKTINQGIAHNYDDDSVLQSLVSASTNGSKPLWWWLILLLPPAFYGLLLITAVIRNKILNDPEATRSRQALAVFRKKLKNIDPANESKTLLALNRDIKEYLAAKLSLNPAALVFADIEEKLIARGVDMITINELRDILHTCEAHAYAGGANRPDDLKKTVRRAEDIGQKIERCR